MKIQEEFGLVGQIGISGKMRLTGNPRLDVALCDGSQETMTEKKGRCLLVI